MGLDSDRWSLYADTYSWYTCLIIRISLLLSSLVKMYGKHVVYTDEGVWYPDACKLLGLEHRIHTCMHTYSIREEPDRESKQIPEGQD